MPLSSITTITLLLLLLVASETTITVSAKDVPPPGIFGGDDNASIARWLVQESTWGTLNAPFAWHMSSEQEKNLNKEDDTTVSGTIIPFAQDLGRIYLYLMGQHELEKGVSLTLSQAALNSDLFGVAGCGMTTDAVVDAQDPRCAKLTLTGTISPLNDKNGEDGLAALFETHPYMGEWPEDHEFQVHELTLEKIWMISGFGGGGDIASEDYFAAEPVEQHDMIGADALPEESLLQNDDDNTPPSLSVSMGAARARWIVHNSLWTTVSTISLSSVASSEDDSDDAIVAFGNIRSIADGSDKAHSTGKPIFYLPTPDPTSKDIAQNPQIVLTFSEAALGSDNHDCEDDPGSLKCGQVILRGQAVKVDEEDDIMNAFAATHPLAPWLSSGDGSHTGGDYYTIGDLEQVALIFHFGTSKTIEPKNYLKYQFPNSDNVADNNNNHHDQNGSYHHHHHDDNNQGDNGENNSEEEYSYHHWDKTNLDEHHQNGIYDRVDVAFSWISGLLIGALASMAFLMHRRHRQDHKYNQVLMTGAESQQQQFAQEPKGITA